MKSRSKPDYWYDQSAVIPFRHEAEVLQVLLVTSRKKRRWVVPKGIKEPDLSAPQSAAKEALEEAGIEGEVLPGSIGTYRYPKWGGTCTVEVFVMQVKKELPAWLEDYRDRAWLPLNTAAERVREPELRRMLLSLPGFLDREQGEDGQ